jgi:hypothetical protein
MSFLNGVLRGGKFYACLAEFRGGVSRIDAFGIGDCRTRPAG